MQPGNYGAPGTDLVQPGAYDPNVTGLEDFDVSDMRLPRLSIDHEKGGFIDSMNADLAMPEIQVIPLGLIKQRVMWPALMTDDNGDSNPMCKSVDHSTGYPNITSADQRELFPWQAAGWDPNAFPRDDANRIVLPCNSCRLKDWGSHPDGKKTWCGEQHAIPVLYAPVDPTVHLQAEPSMLALFTAQRSSINASKAFFGGMVRQQKPAFAFRARWTLKKEQRGKNTYFVPVMTIVGKSDEENWAGYAASYTEIRTFLTQPPRVRDDQQQAGVTGASIAQQNQMGGFQNNTWTPGAPVQTGAPVQGQYVQTSPQYGQYAQPQPQYVPQPQQPAQVQHAPQQPAPQQPVPQQPVQPVATPVSPAPVQRPMASPEPTMIQGSPFPAGPAQAAPSAPTPGRDGDDDPLPF